MTDVGYEKAMARRDECAKAVNEKIQEIEDLKREISRIDRFLSEWREFAGLTPTSEESPTPQDVVAKGRRPDNPSREIVGDKVEEFLRAKGAPISRNDLLRALDVEGIKIEGKDPSMVLSTMLWRMSDRFVRLRGHGYWLRGVPCPAAMYTGDDGVVFAK
jgi:hypothetical protein